MSSVKWNSIENLVPRSFECGFCGNKVASEKGWYGREIIGLEYGKALTIYVCPGCLQPNYFDTTGRQYPGPRYGSEVPYLPPALGSLYEEARACASAGAYTGAVLLCRKVLMNVAVQKGAEEGLQFIRYVEFLAERGYVSPDGKNWLDHIRAKGNEATHEAAPMEQEDAVDLIDLVEMLLRIVFEFPSKVAIKQKAAVIKRAAAKKQSG